VTPEAVEVKLARLEEKIDTILRRLESGDKQFRELDDRVKVLETRIAQLWGGLALASIAIPLIVRYLMEG
jgi:predicted nuclease with TOPRIM domain